MNTRGLFNRLRSMRVVVLFLALLLVYGTISYSPRAATTLPTFTIPVGGVTGTTNNTAFAFGRYVLVAPFWPSKGVDENGELDLAELDNNSIYVIDTKKPNALPLSKVLTAWDSKLGQAKTVYFPTKVVFEPNSSNVYIRGTRFEERDGEVTAIDVIAYVHLNLDDNSKPVFDTTVVPIDIQGVGAPYTGNAPLDFAFDAKGDLMVFTNGASIFSYNLDHGYLYGVGIVPESEYGPDDTISFLDVDPATNVVTVSWNRRVADKEKGDRTSSEISFYRLSEHGTFEILKRVYPDQLPEGASLTSGSNVAVVDDGDSEFALFATNDGSLLSLDLRSETVQASVKRLYSFPELARASADDTDPLLIRYDIATRVIGVVKPGFTVQISRPSNGKRGRISRPSNLHINSVTPPVLAMARLGKKNKVGSAFSFSEAFKGEGGLTGSVNGESSQWLISTYSGRLYSVDISADLNDSVLGFVGLMGSKVDRIDYYPDRASVVAINSLTFEEDGWRVAAPGAVVLGRLTEVQGGSSSVLQALLPTASLLAKPTASIRRPCNIRR